MKPSSSSLQRRRLLGAVPAAAVAFALPTRQATAHGNEHHRSPNAPVVKEQKPWGIAGEARAVRRTVEIRMTDAMRFSPERLELRLGATVRFRIHNDGKLMHEFVLGDTATLDEHAKLMEKFPNMEHDEPYMAHVAPGKTGEIVWRFNRAGEFNYACLIAGHYSAGMIGRVIVGAKP